MLIVRASANIPSESFYFGLTARVRSVSQTFKTKNNNYNNYDASNDFLQKENDVENNDDIAIVPSYMHESNEEDRIKEKTEKKPPSSKIRQHFKNIKDIFSREKKEIIDQRTNALRESFERKEEQIRFHYSTSKTKGRMRCQILRSASHWSLGLKIENHECSIYQAYEGLIEKSQHFIYIENQFFISGSAGVPVENRISEFIVNRIKRAAAEKEKFNVIVVMPLLPVKKL